MSDLDTEHMDDDLMPEIDNKGEETWLLSRDESVGRVRRSATPPPRIRSMSTSSTTSTQRRWKEAATPAEWDREREMLSRQVDEAKVARLDALRRERSTKSSLNLEQRVHSEDNNALQSKLQSLQGKVMNLQKMMNVKERTLDDAKLRSKAAESELLELRLEYYDWKDTVEVAKIDNHDNKELLAVLQSELSKGGKNRWPSLEGSPGSALTPQLPSRGSDVNHTKSEAFTLSESDITTYRHKCLNTPEVFPGDESIYPSPVGSLSERRRRSSAADPIHPTTDCATSPIQTNEVNNWDWEGTGTAPPSPDRNQHVPISFREERETVRQVTIPQENSSSEVVGETIRSKEQKVINSDVRRSLNMDTETSDVRHPLSATDPHTTSLVDVSSPSDITAVHQPSSHTVPGPRQRLHDTSSRKETMASAVSTRDSPVRKKTTSENRTSMSQRSNGGNIYLTRSQNAASEAATRNSVAQERYAQRQERVRSRSRSGGGEQREQFFEEREVPQLSSAYPGQLYGDLRRTDLSPVQRESSVRRTNTSPVPPDRPTNITTRDYSIASLGWDVDASPVRHLTGIEKHRSRERKKHRQQKQRSPTKHPTPTSIVKTVYNNNPSPERVTPPQPKVAKVQRPRWPVLVDVQRGGSTYLTASLRPPPELSQGRYAEAAANFLDYQYPNKIISGSTMHPEYSVETRPWEPNRSAGGTSALTTPQHTPKLNMVIDPSYLGTPMPLPQTDAGKFTPHR